MWEAIKSFGLPIMALGACLSLFGTILMALQDNIQKDNIEKLGNINRDFGVENSKLAKEIKELQKSNSEMTGHISNVTDESKKLISEVKGLTDATKELVSKIDTRTELAEKVNITSGQFRFATLQNIKDNDNIILQMGSNKVSTYGGNMREYLYAKRFFTVEGTESLKFKVINGELTVSATILDHDGKYVLKIEDNKWSRNPQVTGGFNYDQNGFEILDNNGDVIFNLDVQGNMIILQAVFYTPRIVVIYSNNGLMDASRQGDYRKKIRDNVKQLFEYNGDNPLGKRR
jgi:hypothetical protein